MNELIESRSKILGLLLNGKDNQAIEMLSNLRLNRWNVNNFLGIGADANAPVFIKYLIEKKGANVNFKDDKDENSIFRACVAGAEDAFDILLEHKADYKVKNKAGYNCLMAMVKSPYVVEKIIKDFDIHHTSKDGKTALLLALEIENKESIKLIILQASSMKDILIFKKQIKKSRNNKNKKICDYACEEISSIELNFKLQEELSLKQETKKIKI